MLWVLFALLNAFFLKLLNVADLTLFDSFYYYDIDFLFVFFYKVKATAVALSITTSPLMASVIEINVHSVISPTIHELFFIWSHLVQEYFADFE